MRFRIVASIIVVLCVIAAVFLSGALTDQGSTAVQPPTQSDKKFNF